MTMASSSVMAGTGLMLLDFTSGRKWPEQGVAHAQPLHVLAGESLASTLERSLLYLYSH